MNDEESQSNSPQRAVIQSKLEAPPLPEQIVGRPRLRRLLAELIEFHPVVVLSATAGAGKTTAVVDAARSIGRTVAWLTLDRTDALPGRLITYLEASLSRRLPELDGIATRALAAGIPHSEAAGLLADAIGDVPLIFVLDELERLDDDEAAWAVIESFLRYAPASVRTVMVSRRDIPAAVLPQGGRTAWLSDADLAFTVEEAATALAKSGAEGIDAEVAVDATGGWVSGVLFEAWASADHVTGMGGETDPLHGYLSAHVLGQLEPDDRDFLIATSLLDETSAQRAEALGQTQAGERLARLRAAHLPVTWHPDRLVMRCHSRFREYLLERLERRGTEATRELRLRYGRLLAAEGHHEEAAEELLRAGAPEEALASAARVIGDVVERLDFAVAERWLDALGDHASSGASPFTIAELMLAVAQSDFRRGVRVGDQLEALGERERLARSSERAAALMAWCYAAIGCFDDYFELVEQAADGPSMDSARCVAHLILRSSDAPVPELTGGTLDGLIPLLSYYLGRLSELAEMPASPWAQAVAQPWRIGALRASGQTQQALALYELARNAPGPMDVMLETQIGPEILIDAGRHEEARRELGRTQGHARATSTFVWIQNRIVEVRLVLRVDGDLDAARAILARLEPDAHRVCFYGEQVDTWLGFIALLEGENEQALTLLRTAVEGMLAGSRILHLPTAAVFLAEAEWRAGNEDAADAAADTGLDAARRQGSNHLLLQALADFPAVIARRLDAEAGADSAWHELGRALIAQGVSVDAHLRADIELREFGRCEILVDGAVAKPAISKSLELLAFLASRPDGQAEREELLDALFDGRADNSARAYLRQAILRLREVLPDKDALVVEQGRVSLRDDLAIDTESTRFDAGLAEAARLQGEPRLAATLDALATVDQGEYLPGINSAWVEERRNELADRARDARHEAAELSFASARYQDARRLQEDVLRDDPYREAVWRLSMRIANALGDGDGVISAYRECERALAELGTEPAPATRALLASMRR